MKITYSVATSRDGFIARCNGDVSWLEEQNVAPEDTGLAEFFAEIDGLVMGRGTYDFVFGYGSWPYEDKLSWVLTYRELEILEGANLKVSGSIEEVISDANARNVQHLWLLGGGQLASAFLERELITQISIAEMPVELGDGIPLFARHRLDDLSFLEKSVQEKKGFRQIELTVS